MPKSDRLLELEWYSIHASRFERLDLRGGADSSRSWRCSRRCGDECRSQGSAVECTAGDECKAVCGDGLVVAGEARLGVWPGKEIKGISTWYRNNVQTGRTSRTSMCRRSTCQHTKLIRQAKQTTSTVR